MEKLSLWAPSEYESTDDGFAPWLELSLLDTDRPLGAIVVCPGGGYVARAEHEALRIAKRANELGFHGFVVQYSVAPHKHPQPLLDLSRAMRLIRQHAFEWHVAPEHLAVLGFSAGGHLAGSLGVHHAAPYLQEEALADRFSNAPNALILCYPVISGVNFAHQGSFTNLSGGALDKAFLEEMSLELHVTEATPPAFLWHTADDATVPVENSLLFAQALSQAKVPFELHIYPHGRHGLGLAEENPHIATWSSLAGEWLRSLGWPAA